MEEDVIGKKSAAGLVIRVSGDAGIVGALDVFMPRAQRVLAWHCMRVGWYTDDLRLGAWRFENPSLGVPHTGEVP